MTPLNSSGNTLSEKAANSHDIENITSLKSWGLSFISAKRIDTLIINRQALQCNSKKAIGPYTGSIPSSWYVLKGIRYVTFHHNTEMVETPNKSNRLINYKVETLFLFAKLWGEDTLQRCGSIRITVAHKEDSTTVLMVNKQHFKWKVCPQTKSHKRQEILITSPKPKLLWLISFLFYLFIF